MRDTPYATEIVSANITFPDGSEGRIERLFLKEIKEQGIRFSWWKKNKKNNWSMSPRPLDFTENQLLALLKSALQQGVFSKDFLASLKEML